MRTCSPVGPGARFVRSRPLPSHVRTVFRWTPARAAASARDSQSGSAKLDPLVDQSLDAVQAFIAIMKRADEMPNHDGERGDTPERGYPHDARGLREHDRYERRDDPRDKRRCSSHPDPLILRCPGRYRSRLDRSSLQVYNRIPLRYPSTARSGGSEAAPGTRSRSRRSHIGQFRRGPTDGARPGRARPRDGCGRS
jgi:hypothetical protein